MLADSARTINLPELEDFSPNDIGQELHWLISELEPIPNITGNGFRETLNIINRYIPLEVHEKCIASSLETGHLTYGECLLEGESSDEVLISCHASHPSLCNDNLSGIALAVFLAKHLSQQSLRYSYRFLFIPGTTGSITWLSLNEDRASRIKHGLVLTCVGGPGKLTYKKSRRGDMEIDKIVAYVLKRSATDYKISAKGYELTEFFPSGYDERQFCAPGFVLAVGCLMRSTHDFSEYDPAADNLSFVKPQYLADSFSKCLAIFQILENNKIYLNQNPKSEPQLSKRSFYRAISGYAEEELNTLAIFWVLNLSDGSHTLLDISQRSGLTFEAINKAANALLKHDLLKLCCE